MRRIAITGGPATGKTTVLSILRELGYPTFSADEVVRRLTAPGGPVHRRLQELCPWAVGPGRTLDRRRMLKRLIEDRKFRKTLEELLHPRVKEELLAFFKTHSGKELLFAEVPLLFEVGWEELFDEIWVVACGEETQRVRLGQRLSDPRLVEGLLALQLPLAEKIKRAHRVLWSEKPPEVLKNELQEWLSRMRSPCSERP